VFFAGTCHLPQKDHTSQYPMYTLDLHMRPPSIIHKVNNESYEGIDWGKKYANALYSNLVFLKTSHLLSFFLSSRNEDYCLHVNDPFLSSFFIFNYSGWQKLFLWAPFLIVSYSNLLQCYYCNEIITSRRRCCDNDTYFKLQTESFRKFYLHVRRAYGNATF